VTALVVEALSQPPVAARRVELVERKGLGHPDSICDALVETIAIALNRMYRERTGAILHYNIDKALLVAGQCAMGFGWGEVTRPMTFYVGDRATFEADGVKLPVEDALHEAVEAWLTAHLPRIRPGQDFQVRSVLAPGSVELRGVVTASAGAVASNDTSGASGHAPLSPTESTVLAVERFLNGPAFKTQFPDAGEDVKVFGVREDDRLRLTVAMPLVCVATASEAAYFARKEAILAALAAEFRDVPLTLEWRLNNLDTPGRGADATYLTVTGTSAEHGDSGQVGRGNRANGLIAFARPTGGEATAGKNAVAHPGKVYSILSHRLAGLIHAQCPGLEEVYVHLAARIGEPVDRPWTGVQVILPRGVALGDVEPAIREVVETELARLPAFREELVRGAHPVC
jgi:S-adenosylmethionine synthetase